MARVEVGNELSAEPGVIAAELGSKPSVRLQLKLAMNLTRCDYS